MGMEHRGKFSFVLLSCLLASSGCQLDMTAEGRTECEPRIERKCRCSSPDGPVEICLVRGLMRAGCDCSESVTDGAMVTPIAGAAAPRAGRSGASGLVDGGDTGPSDPGTTTTAGSGGDGQAPVAGSGAEPAAVSVKVEAEPRDEAAYLFDQAQLRTYDIQIDPADLAAIDQQPSAETWVPASLEFEGATYGPYQVRYKGAAGSFRYPCTTGTVDDPKSGKCSIKLGFNEVQPDATFYGLRKLNFHALNTDASMLRDRLGYALFREHGVAAPRTVHARVLINGQFEGLFAVVEQIDGRFTRARFDEGGAGNVYKEVWPLFMDAQRYQQALETNEDEQPSLERMLAFNRALAAGESTIGSFLNAEYLARYLAVDRVIVNDDGALHFYCDAATGRSWNHNYYWYEAVLGEQFWIIPWDMDYSFDGSPWVRLNPAWTETAPCTCTGSDFGSQVPASCDPLVKQFIGHKDAVEAEIDAFLSGPFAADRVDAKLQQWSEQIRPAVMEAAGIKHAPSEVEWAAALEQLKLTVGTARERRGAIH
jgi:CotH kinase protein